ncbi:MAG: ACP S-malonyltransferase [Candidatus Ratteibacteria bacterium]|nr:ACP S-malonyltransferase [Candidatus Ratteibacteria bacterium]
MNRIAFIFPGQGSQYTGMGKDFFETSGKIRDLYAEAETVLKINLSEKIFNGNAEALKDTAVSQPAIFLTSFSCCRMLEEADIFPEVMAGHSLGEYSALTCSETFSFSDGLKIVQKRSLWMAEASREHPGKMAAVIGLSAEEVRKICQSVKGRGVISTANLNSPRQTVISGESLAVEEAMKLARERGAGRVVVLRVSGAFHTELMKEAGDKLKGFLDSIDLKPPRVPVVSNVTANSEKEPLRIKENLIKQVSHPVRWTDSVENLINQGFNVFIEVGPRRVLSGLLAQFGNKEIISLNVEDRESLEKTKEAVSKVT